MKKLNKLLLGTLFLAPVLIQAIDASQNNTSSTTLPSDPLTTWAIVEVLNEFFPVGILPQPKPKKQYPPRSVIEMIDILTIQNENLLTLEELMQTAQPKKGVIKAQAKDHEILAPRGRIQDNLHREIYNVHQAIYEARSALRKSDAKLSKLRKAKDIEFELIISEEVNNNIIEARIIILTEELKELEIKRFQLGL